MGMLFNPRTSRLKRRIGGFTLVELLVVIGMIAVLIAILLPVLGKARAQANRTVCLSNIRQLGVGILMYCNDNKGWFPTCAFGEYPGVFRQYPDDWVHWEANRDINNSAIAKYAGRGEQLKALLRCPADTFDGRKTDSGLAPGQGPYLYSYGFNSALAQNVVSGQYRTKITRWKSSSRKVMLTEPEGSTDGTIWDPVYGPSWGAYGYLARRHGVVRLHRAVPGNPIMQLGTLVGVNVSAAFLDGHAESIDQHIANNRIHEQPQAH